RPYRGKPEDGSKPGGKPARPYKGKPTDRKGGPGGKSGGYGKGRKGKPVDAKRSFGRKGPGK
ncbi:MAG TPA: hypothetical protein PLF89_16150, partial [bacterium]|nr:hypothetical protein [bacterium]